MSIGLACNFYRETNAIHGLLETASQFFDDLVFISAPPSGESPDDETIDVLRKWGCRVVFSNIDKGFGVIRTEALHASNCEWVMILDADERFIPLHYNMLCSGEESWDFTDSRPNLSVERTGVYNQGKLLRDAIQTTSDCIITRRRHWFDFSWKNPTQNWHRHPDWQRRILRNRDYIGFKPEAKMHEQAVNFKTGKLTTLEVQDLYHDHFHCLFKPMETEQRAEDIRVYDALSYGKALPVGGTSKVNLRIGQT